MKKGFVAAVAVLGTIASTALIMNVTNAFGLGKGMGSEAPSTEQITQHLQAKGFTDEQIQNHLAQRDDMTQAHQEALANLMGIDTETLAHELESSTVPELLDKYHVSHVDLHEAMTSLWDEFPHERRGPRGFGLGL